MPELHLFEEELSVPVEELELELRGIKDVPWSPFWLNPRRLRGSDFLMRWSQGQWSEERFVAAVNNSGGYFALPYGPSSVAPDNDVRAFELYFERLEAAGLAEMKRPDLLIFSRADQKLVEQIVEKIGGVGELPFTPEENRSIQRLLEQAIVAVECENSLWVARQMPAFGAPLRPMPRLGGLPGLPKGAVLPTIIVKEEDRGRLHDWQAARGMPIHIWHGFYDLAFGISLDRIDSLIADGYIEPTSQTFQAPSGSTTVKIIYKVYYHYAYPLGESIEEPALVADHLVDRNGHILPYVRFQGGEMELAEEALQVLRNLADERGVSSG
jgi:hypothetical protein